MGSELQARHVAASTPGATQLCRGCACVGSGWRRRVALGGPAHRSGGAVHIHRNHPDEPQALGSGSRSWVPGDSHALESWGKLHAVRTTLSLIATALYMWLLVGA